MKGQKSNFTVYTSLPKIDSASKTTNIIDLIKRNKEEEKKEKVQKFYVLVGFATLIVFFGIFKYL